MHIVLLKNYFSAISSIIVFGFADQQRNVFMVKSMKKILRQTFSMFEPEQCLEMGNYKYSYDRNFVIFWQMELVCFFCFFFGTSCLF